MLKITKESVENLNSKLNVVLESSCKEEEGEVLTEGKEAMTEDVVDDTIKELMDTKWSGSNEEQGKAIQLLRGLAFSDSPKANKFMKELDDATSSMKVDDLAEESDDSEEFEVVKENNETDKKLKLIKKIEGILKSNLERPLLSGSFDTGEIRELVSYVAVAIAEGNANELIKAINKAK